MVSSLKRNVASGARRVGVGDSYQPVAESRAGGGLQSVVQAAYGRLRSRHAHYLEVVDADIEPLAGAYSHFHSYGGIDAQMTVQLVGQHGGSPFVAAVAPQRLVDDRLHVVGIERLLGRKAVEHAALGIGTAAQYFQQSLFDRAAVDIVCERVKRDAACGGVCGEQLGAEQQKQRLLVPVA